MRFAAILNKTTADDDKLRVPFPAAGHIKNLLFQIIADLSLSGDADDFRMSFSPDVQNYEPITVDAEVQQLIGQYGYSYLVQPFGENPDVENIDDYQVIMYDFDPRKYKVKKGVPWFLQLGSPADNRPELVIVQGDFLPYDGAEWREFWTVNAISAGDDFDEAYQFPISMKDVLLEIKLTSTGATQNTQASGHIDFHKIKDATQFEKPLVDQGLILLNDSTLLDRIPFSAGHLAEEYIKLPYVAEGERLDRILSGT